jgi:membrane-associated phospholipid phosphatase
MRSLVRRLTILALLAITITPQGPSVATGRPSSPHASGRVAIAVDLIVLDGVAAERLNPVRAARLLAYVSVAMARASDDHPASELAVVSAATGVLDGLLPAQAEAAHNLLARTRTELAENGVNPGQLRAADRRGAGIAGRLLSRAARDGADTNQAPSSPQFPGAWQPTPPGYLPALEPTAGTWRTWHLRRGDTYRPAPPPRPGDADYDAQVAEVYAVANRLTPEQAAIARFWADGPGSITPAGHWNMIAVELLGEHRATLTETTLVLAALNTAQADAFIACWDAKFAHNSERPVTAIRRDLDAGFLPLLATPPFPSYVSGHSTTSAAAAVVLGEFFPSAGAQLENWAAEAAVSRLYAGIHFRIDNDAGLRLGRLVGKATLREARTDSIR